VAWAAGPGRREPAKAMIELDKLLDDKVPAVRAATARGLLFVADPKLARDHAARRRGREQVPEVLQALDHTLRQLDARAK
jgi:Flp pilus assembly protein TadD